MNALPYAPRLPYLYRCQVWQCNATGSPFFLFEILLIVSLWQDLNSMYVVFSNVLKLNLQIYWFISRRSQPVCAGIASRPCPPAAAKRRPPAALRALDTSPLPVWAAQTLVYVSLLVGMMVCLDLGLASHICATVRPVHLAPVSSSPAGNRLHWHSVKCVLAEEPTDCCVPPAVSAPDWVAALLAWWPPNALMPPRCAVPDLARRSTQTGCCSADSLHYRIWKCLQLSARLNSIAASQWSRARSERSRSPANRNGNLGKLLYMPVIGISPD